MLGQAILGPLTGNKTHLVFQATARQSQSSKSFLFVDWKRCYTKWKNHLPRSQHPHIIHINTTDLPHWRYMTTLHSNQPFLSNHARLQELSAWGDGAAAEVASSMSVFWSQGFSENFRDTRHLLALCGFYVFLPDFNWIVFSGRWLILSIKCSSTYDSTGWKHVQIGCFLFFFESSARPLTNIHPGAADPVEPSSVLTLSIFPRGH